MVLKDKKPIASAARRFKIKPSTAKMIISRSISRKSSFTKA